MDSDVMLQDDVRPLMMMFLLNVRSERADTLSSKSSPSNYTPHRAAVSGEILTVHRKEEDKHSH